MRLSTRDVALFGILGGATFAAKMVMMGLPNIEPTSLMVMLFGVCFGKKAADPVYVYVLLEILINGMNLWSINYLYVWIILAWAAWMLREMTHPLGWAVLSGGFGLLFGLLCAIPYLFIGLPGGGSAGGLATAFTWWIAGIPWDIVHGVANFLLMLVLYHPVRKVMQKVERVIE